MMSAVTILPCENLLLINNSPLSSHADWQPVKFFGIEIGAIRRPTPWVDTSFELSGGLLNKHVDSSLSLTGCVAQPPRIARARIKTLGQLNNLKT
jgi:hypothetical protein